MAEGIEKKVEKLLIGKETNCKLKLGEEKETWKYVKGKKLLEEKCEENKKGKKRK